MAASPAADVTVVIPAYNPGKRLERAIDSVLAQSYRGWQLIVVDDGSKEDLTWCRALDDRIRFVRKENGGVSSARNRGAKEAQSEWIAFLDADDEWEPEKLLTQLKLASDNPEVAAIHTGFRWITPDAEFDAVPPAVLNIYDILRGATVCMSTLMIRRSVLIEIGGFDEGLAQAEDLDLYNRLAGRYPIHAAEGSLASYYTHESGASADYWPTFWSGRRMRAHARRRYRHDPQAIRSISQGARRAHEIVSAQAMDKARKLFASKNPQFMLHLTRSIMFNPVFVARSIGSWFRSQRQRRTSRARAKREDVGSASRR